MEQKLLRLTYAASCISLLVTMSSCSKDHEKNAVTPKAHTIAWGNASLYQFEYEDPIDAIVAGDGRYLACNYVVDAQKQRLVSAVCLVDLLSETHRWIEPGFGARIRSVCPGMLGIFPTSLSARKGDKGYLLNPGSMQATMQGIPGGSPIVGEGGAAVAVKTFDEQWELADDIWLLDTESRAEMILGADEHGLSDVDVLLASNRLVLSGWATGSDGEFEDMRTQLWKWPEMEKISEYEMGEETVWFGGYYTALVGSELFSFGYDVGPHKVASLSTGEVLFTFGPSVSRVVLEKSLDLTEDVRVPSLRLLEGAGHVDDTGRIVCFETTQDGSVTAIKTYDAVTGEQVDAVAVDDPRFVDVVEVAHEWVILCSWGDCEDVPANAPSPEPCTMWVVPYRLKDLAKGKNSIQVMWGGVHEPEVVGGKLILVMTDHANIIDLSNVVSF